MEHSLFKIISCLLCFTLVIAFASNAQAQEFTNSANPSPAGPNCIWADYDSDGDLDILVTGNNNTVLMRNDCGVYVNSGILFPALAGSSFVDWEDYDKDGDPDLLLSGDDLSDGPPYVTVIYRNDDGVFVDIAADLLPMRFGSADWGDYDNDGDIDLVMTGHFGPANVSGFATRLYRNDNGTFTQLDINLPGVRSGVITWADYDNDNDLDLLLAGPRTCAPVPQVCNSDPFAEIYRNDNGAFTAIGAGIEPYFKATSAAWADYDNDNDVDFVIMGQIATGYSTKVYRNDGGTFVEVASVLPNARGGQHSVAWGDCDNDGDLDLLIGGDSGAGGVLAVYKNTTGTLSLLTDLLPVITAGTVNWGDSDGDGDLDILAAGYIPFEATPATAVYHNNLNPIVGLLKNYGFEQGTSPWTFYTNGTGTFTSVPSGPSSCFAAKIAIATPGNNTQMYQTGMVLEPRTRYRLRFSAYSTLGHNLSVVLHRNSVPYTNYGLNWSVDLGTSWQSFVTEFVTTGFITVTENARLRFAVNAFGAAGENYYIDDVLLEKVGNTTPVITSHPEDKTVSKFQTATFTVAATGAGPLSYQWQKNNVNIAFATNASYTTPQVILGDDGTQFRCNVSNPYGSVYSNPATLHVIPAINVIQNASFDDGSEGWTFFTNGTGSLSAVAPGFGGTGNCGRVLIGTPGTNVQLTQSGIPLEPNTMYDLGFYAYSSSGHNMSVYLHKQGSPYTNYGVNNWIVDLTNVWQRFSSIITTSGFSSAVSDARLRFWFAPFDAAGDQFFIDDVRLVKMGPGKLTVTEQPVLFALHQNYPNPFNPITVISYDLPLNSRVSLKVYDLLGKEISSLVDAIQESGVKSVEFDASNLASGVYLYRIQAGDFVASKKLVVIK